MIDGLRAKRQKMGDHFLASRVVAGSPSGRFGKSEHRLDAAAQAGGGDGPVGQGQQHPENQIAVDVVHGHVAEDGKRMPRNSRPPFVLLVAPAGRVGLEVFLGILRERGQLCAGGTLFQRRGFACINRIDAACQLLAGLRRQFARGRQRHGAHRAQAHRAADAVALIKKDPRFRATACYLEM